MLGKVLIVLVLFTGVAEANVLYDYYKALAQREFFVMEDFNDYTEVDGGGDVTIVSNSRITVSSMIKNVTTYVHRTPSSVVDEFVIRFRTKKTADIGTAYQGYIFSLQQVADTEPFDVANRPSIYARWIGTDRLQLIVNDAGTEDIGELASTTDDVWYYVEIRKKSDKVTMRVFSDQGFTNILMAHEVSSISSTYPVLQTISSRDSSGTDSVTFELENMRLATT